MLVAHAPSFGGIFAAFSFWVSSLSTSGFSFSSSKDPLFEDTPPLNRAQKASFPTNHLSYGQIASDAVTLDYMYQRISASYYQSRAAN